MKSIGELILEKSSSTIIILINFEYFYYSIAMHLCHVFLLLISCTIQTLVKCRFHSYQYKQTRQKTNMKQYICVFLLRVLQKKYKIPKASACFNISNMFCWTFVWSFVINDIPYIVQSRTYSIILFLFTFVWNIWRVKCPKNNVHGTFWDGNKNARNHKR